VAAAAVLVAAATLLWRDLRPAAPRRAMLRVDLDLGRGFRAHPRDGHALLSPDGSRIVFAGLDAGGKPDFFVRRLDRAGSVPLGTDGGRDPFFSPDGEWLGYFNRERLWKVRVAGGRPVEICEAPAPTSRGADWGDDGFIVGAYGPEGGLARVPESGGTAVPLTSLDASRRERSHGWPQVLPGSGAVVFTSRALTADSGGGTIEAVSVVSGRRTTLQRDGEFGRYLPCGYLVFVRRSTLFAAPMDAARLELTGLPVPVLGPVAFDEASGRLHFSVAATGDALTLTGDWRDGGASLVGRGAETGSAATLLLGFCDELRRLVPAGGR
jgi:serine/threonine-protein kinase